MLKLSQKQILDLLAEVGVRGVEVVEEDNTEVKFEDLYKSVDDTRGALLKPRWESETRESLEKAADGKAFASLRGALKRTTDLKEEDFADLKTYPQYAELVVGHLNTKKAPKEGEFEAKLKEATEALNAEWEAKYNPLLQEKEGLVSKFSEKERMDVYQSKFKTLPLSEKLDRQIAASDFDKFANSIYDVKVENGEEKYYEKGTNILALNGGKVIKTEDLAKSYFEPRNNWVTSMAGKNAVEELQKVADGKTFVEQQKGVERNYGEKANDHLLQMAEKSGMLIPE